MKLFLKSFRRRRLFEKRRHPKTFLVFKHSLQLVFRQASLFQWGVCPACAARPLGWLSLHPKGFRKPAHRTGHSAPDRRDG
ncbi:hypothetical protein F1645_05810 [Novacetimonas hansenii]